MGERGRERAFLTIVTSSGSTHVVGEQPGNRLTSFANDPVVDPTAKLFVRDEASGDAVATPGPMTRQGRAVRRASFRWGHRYRASREAFATSSTRSWT
jgi:hypothetical protein